MYTESFIKNIIVNFFCEGSPCNNVWGSRFNCPFRGSGGMPCEYNIKSSTLDYTIETFINYVTKYPEFFETHRKKCMSIDSRTYVGNKKNMEKLQKTLCEYCGGLK